MEKSEFKKCLQIIDKIEAWNLTKDTFFDTFFHQAEAESFLLDQDMFSEMIHHLIESNNFIQFDNTFDLSEPLYIFSRTQHHSKLEALSIFEAMIQHPDYYSYCNNHLSGEIDLSSFGYFKNILVSTNLFTNQNDRVLFNPDYLDDLTWILKDKKEGYNCSYALKTYYTHQLYHKLSLEFRNEEKEMISFPNKEKILAVFPKKGIPVDRDCSKELQNFFKDTLLNEFKHQCCICHINIVQLLIASHIKPFRDCSYLIEAMDNNNGLLLCRNHDYLFDQGYISFDADGQIIISKEIANNLDIYQLHQNFKLPSCVMTPTRKEFLSYHRKNLLKQ